MRVFVVGTGRCGTVSFATACKHFRNYTVGHETPSPQLEYPDRHIEVSPHLCLVLPLIAAKYPDSYWVHLVRERVQCCESIIALEGGKVLTSLRYLYRTVFSWRKKEAAERFYDATNATLRVLLNALVPADNRVELRLERAREWWGPFCERVGAIGNLPASLTEWDVPKNTRAQREGKKV